MRSNENYHQPEPTSTVASKRRLPFNSSSTHMSSSTALKRAVSTTFRHPQINHRHDIFLNKSSSSSSRASSVIEGDNDVKNLDETFPDNGLNQFDKRKPSTTTNRHSTMNNQNSKKDIGGTMIQELLQSNMDLKKEIRDIRRQIRYNNNGTNKQRIDRSISTTNHSNKSKILNDNNNNNNNNNNNDDECSYIQPERDYYNDQSATMLKLQQYKKESTMYKQELERCRDTITHLRKTISSMEKRIEQLKTNEHRQVTNVSNQHESFPNTSNNSTDHRFIHELFHSCIKHTPRSSKLKTNVPSHHDMKTFIRQTFNDLIKTSSIKTSANKNTDINHFVCKCSDRIHTDHRPSYQYCLSIVEQCQSLFDVTCFTQLSTALNELYYRYGELINFKRSIASTLGINENSRLVSCPKIIKTLEQTLADAKSNELITFKKMAKINDMNEAISKIRSYDDFVPYYHQFIEQMANLLEVSKGDEIMPAIKTLKLLAHGDNYRPTSSSTQQSHSLTRASSLNAQKDFHDKHITQSKSLRTTFSSIPNIEQNHENNHNHFEKQNNDSEQPQTGTDDGDS